MSTEHRGSGIQPPGYVRVAGGLLLVLGMMLFVWFQYDGKPWSWSAVGTIWIIGGAGLIVGQRWAWPFLLLSSIPFLFAAYVFFLPESETDPFELDHWAGVLFLAIGCLLFIGSVTRRTRGWLLGRPSGRATKPSAGSTI